MRSLLKRLTGALTLELDSMHRSSLRRVRALPQIHLRAGDESIGESVELRTPERVTTNRDANEQQLYYTSPSLCLDESHLIFLSDRTGHPNLYSRNLASGREEQLSHNRERVLKSYVYFGGRPYLGLGMASPSLHAASGTVYFIQGRSVLRARPGGETVPIATLPEGKMTAYTHVSGDGKRLCVPTVDALALDGDRPLRGHPSYGVARRIRQEGLSSYLHVYDTVDGRELACEPVPGAWVTHVQFSPVNPDWILYNHEWSGQSGVLRMWLWDGLAHRALRTEGEGRSRRDWACHEVWSHDGDSVLYHGRYRGGRDFIGRIRIQSNETMEIPLPAGWDWYGHYDAPSPASLISDGYFRPAGPAGGHHCPWLSRIDIDWSAGQMTWTPLTAHLTSWRSQDAHPHPRTVPSGRYVYFNSDRDGRRAVYRVALDPG